MGVATIRVLIVHSADLALRGGAELSLQHHVRHRPAHVRVDVRRCEAQPWVGRYDAVVLANLRPFEELGQDQELTATLRWTRRLRRFRGFSLRSERDVHPCAKRDGSCLQGSPLEKLACECGEETSRALEHLYDACSAVQFLSPLHQRAITQLIPVRRPQHLIAAPIALDRFRSTVPVEQRQPQALLIGDTQRVAATAEERAQRAGFEPVRVAYRSVPPHEMPELYNRYQAVVVDPVMLHAFGRVAVEALACGCRLLASERVGALSWEDPVKAATEANELFWRTVLTGVEACAGA